MDRTIRWHEKTEKNLFSLKRLQNHDEIIATSEDKGSVCWLHYLLCYVTGEISVQKTFYKAEIKNRSIGCTHETSLHFRLSSGCGQSREKFAGYP